MRKILINGTKVPVRSFIDTMFWKHIDVQHWIASNGADKVECYLIADWKSIWDWGIKANIIMNWLYFEPGVVFHSCKYIHVARFSVLFVRLITKKRTFHVSNTIHNKQMTNVDDDQWPCLFIYALKLTSISENCILVYSSMFISMISILFSISIVFHFPNTNEIRKQIRLVGMRFGHKI